MRRTARILLHAATAASLALFLATLTLWLRSHHLTEQLDWRTDRGWRSLRTARGHVVLGLYVADSAAAAPGARSDRPRYRREDPAPPYNWLMEMNGSPGDTLADREFAGFGWHERRNAGRGTLHAIVVVPFWALAAATAALPAARTVRRWRRFRRGHDRPGHCPTCGYDLRATRPIAAPSAARCRRRRPINRATSAPVAPSAHRRATSTCNAANAPTLPRSGPSWRPPPPAVESAPCRTLRSA